MANYRLTFIYILALLGVIFIPATVIYGDDITTASTMINIPDMPITANNNINPNNISPNTNCPLRLRY